ncbi:Alpha/Beta hydrolase protein [Melanogaster broomeanus]|nr:Alpha/Beta hydrolase protein [Melanogaster broomeanus]
MSFDSFQQVFSLSLCSNIVNDQKGTEDTLQQALQGALAHQLPTYGDWTTVWGPVVWKFKPADADTGPDNSWFVAYNPSLTYADGSTYPSYVVAVAGTPTYSSYAWIQENFAVDSVVNFVTWVRDGITNPPERVMPKDIVAGTPYAAMGIAKAVHNLLTKPAPSGSASAGTTLIDFLANIPDGTRIVFAGHSLGGALSSTLALSLVNSGTIPKSSALTYTSAGPSPGNRAFADLYASTFPAQRFPGSEAGGYQVWNLNVVNSKDIVPQAWCAIKALSPDQNLDNIPTIFGLPALLLIQGITLLLKIQAFRSGAIYIPLQSHIVPGFPPQAPPANLQEFLTIAVQQHNMFYVGLFGVPIPAFPESERASLGLVRKTKEEQRYEYPIIGNFEYAAENPQETQNAVEELEGTPEAKEVGGL